MTRAPTPLTPLEPEPFYWPEDAAVLGAQCARMGLTRAETERDARDAGCPERLIARVLDGWTRERSRWTDAADWSGEA